MTDSHAHISMQPISDDIENILHDFTSKGGTKILNASYKMAKALPKQQNS